MAGGQVMNPLPQSYESVVHMLAAAAANWPEREALVCGEDRLTYGEYFEAVAGLAEALKTRGANGQRVALIMTNSVDICIAMFAAHAARAQVVPINPLYTAAELEPILRDAEPVVLVHDDAPRNAVGKVLERIEIKNVIEIGPGTKQRAFDIRAAALPQPLPTPESLATLQYTGGTTGVSKGVDLTHQQISINISQREALLPTGRDGERILSVLPLFHIYGVAMCLHNAVYAGATLVILPRFTPAEAFTLLAQERISILAGSPTVFIGMISDERFQSADFSHLKLSYSGASALPEALLDDWKMATGAPVLEGFGQSEAAPVVSFNPLNGEYKAGSVGIALPSTEIQIVDAADGITLMPNGTPGELRVRGPQVMRGYRNRPQESAVALRDGWLYTGDIGELDDDSYLYIRDRKKDMIIVSGYNVYPREIEELLHRHPQILEAAVIGVADDYRGEIPCAYVVAASAQSINDTQLDDYCRENLAPYKRPRRYEFIEALPKTNVGKIDKLALRTLNSNAATE
jgi:long-chain acyl-CoA synthetase